MQLFFGNHKERVATLVLVAATIMVGISIVTEGNTAKVLNGIAGATWFVATVLFITLGMKIDRTPRIWISVLVLTAVVAFVVRPSDILLAGLGFFFAGLLASFVAGRKNLVWAKMVPALYLPMHIGTAIVKAMVRSALGMESVIRTDPPPTAALVPIMMVIAAVAGGAIASQKHR